MNIPSPSLTIGERIRAAAGRVLDAARIIAGTLVPIEVLELRRKGTEVEPRPSMGILPLSTDTDIPPGASAQITARPQRVAFRPERFMISNPGAWMINDIKIGNRSQFSQKGDVPGEVFAPDAIASALHFETAQTAMDVVVIVTNRSDKPMKFEASMTGLEARY